MSDKSLVTTRRGVLRSGLAVAGVTAVAGTSVTATASNGKLVFTYDDGPVEDLTRTYRKAHRKEGVPGCSAVPSAEIGHKGKLSAAQLRTLADAGWEIMSHTIHHRALTSIGVTHDIEPNDRKIYAETNIHGKIPGDTLLVTDGSESTTVTVAGKGSDSQGEFVKLESAVGRAFKSSDGVTERYTDNVLRDSLSGSKQQLEQYGVTVTNIVMPYGGYGNRTQELVGEYYTAVANGGLAIGGRGQINRPGKITLPNLSRAMFRQGQMTYGEIGTYLDKVASADALGIFGGHSWERDQLSPKRIRTVIQMAKDRNIEIVTLRDALSKFGITNTPVTTGTTTTRSGKTTTKTRTSGSRTTETTGRTTNPSTTTTTTETSPTSSRRETPTKTRTSVSRTTETTGRTTNQPLMPTTTETSQSNHEVGEHMTTQSRAESSTVGSNNTTDQSTPNWMNPLGIGSLAALASVGGGAIIKRYKEK